MRIAVIGAGAVGAYFGGRLAAAGHSVHLLARGEQLRALRERGLTVRSPLGDLDGLRVQATDDPHGIGPADVVLVAVKSQDLDAAVHTASLLVDDDTAVISLLNGVHSEEVLVEALGQERVLGGVVYIEADRTGPGVVEHRSSFARLVFGELDGVRSGRAEAFLQACLEAGIDAEMPDDIHRAIWTKWLFICAFSGLTALLRRPIGVVLDDPDCLWAYRAAMEEIAALAAAQGVDLPADIVEDRLRFSREQLDPAMRSSLLADLERGRPLELEALNGHAVTLGRRLGVPTPVNATIYAGLKPFRRGG